MNRRDAFTSLYKNKTWNPNGISVSGPSSEIDAADTVSEAISWVLSNTDTKSVLDIGCGDLNWMNSIPEIKQLNYTGVDIVEDLIKINIKKCPWANFIHADVVDYQIPYADLIICRDVLFHQTTEDAKKILKNIQLSGSKFALLTSSNNMINFKNFSDKKCRFKKTNLKKYPFKIRGIIKEWPESKYRRSILLCNLY